MARGGAQARRGQGRERAELAAGYRHGRRHGPRRRRALLRVRRGAWGDQRQPGVGQLLRRQAQEHDARLSHRSQQDRAERRVPHQFHGADDAHRAQIRRRYPYFQHFTGEEFFQHEFPHERSDLSHWRKRLGGKLELLLAESLRVAHESGALRTKDLARVTVDTTVQPKDITFPTDAKLLHAAIKGLTRLARKRGVRLRQSYVRIAKRAAMMAGRYAHAKQFNRHRRQLRILRTRLGRLIRDIRRKIAGNAELEAVFAWPLSRADQIRSQQQRQRGWKLYSF